MTTQTTSPPQLSSLSPHPSDDVLVRVEHVSKKFCRSLKRSLWYGMKDLGSELTGSQHSDNKQLRKDEFWAVNDVSFELKRGECLGLIGRNGAGKTTLLRMLNGLIKPDKGRIEMHGRVGALIALGAGFNPILTGRENIYVNASVLGLSKKDIDAKFDEIVEFAELGEFIDAPVQSYSSGMSIKLGFAVTTALDPDILIIDEVLAVGDMGFRAKCYDVMGRLSRKTAIIFVSHSMPIVSRICNRAILMNNGKELIVGQPEVAIEGYFAQFPIGADPTVNLMPNNTLHILAVEIRKMNGFFAYNRISYGEGLIIKINLNSDKDLYDLIGRLSFLRTDLLPVAISDSKLAGFSVNIRKGLNTISIIIPKLLLGPSKYMLGFTLTPNNCFESILWVPAMSELVIEGKFIPNAPYYLEAAWEVAFMIE
jgi:lipopolysaccharide transport system ATP-binding protein